MAAAALAGASLVVGLVDGPLWLIAPGLLGAAVPLRQARQRTPRPRP